MRRARIQVKPVLNPRATRPTSDNAGSKEGESHQKPAAEEGTSGSVPAAAETNSSTSRAPNLNIRRPAFSVRPKPSLRGLGVPNLHGTQPAPILIPPSSQDGKPVGSGDAVEPVVKETKESTKVPVSVPALLDVKEGPAATPEKEPLVETKNADTEKDIPNVKEAPSLFQRRSKFQIRPKIQSNSSSLPPISSGLQPPDQGIKENVPAPEKFSEVQENKSSLSNETIKTSKTIPTIESDDSFLCSKPDTKSTKSTAAEFPAADTSVITPVVGADTTSSSIIQKETADKEKLQEPNTEVISKPITTPHEHSDKTELLQKPETTTIVAEKTSQPSVKTLSNDETLMTSTGMKSNKQVEDTQSDNNSASKEIKPVPIRRSRFSVQPKLGVKAPIRKPSTTSQPVESGQSLTHTQTAENKSNDDAKDTTTSKPAAPISDSTKNESDSVSVPRRNKFQIQPKLNLKGRVPLSSRLTSVDVQPESLGSTSAQGAGHQDQPDAPVKVGVEENIESSTSKSESTDLSRHTSFQTQPKPSTTTTKPPDSSSKIIAKNLPASQSVTTTDDSTSISIPMEVDGAKEKEDSENKVTNKDVDDASPKEMTSKVENTVLPKCNRFQMQSKASTKTREQPDSSSKITAKNLPASQSVTMDDSTTVSIPMEVDGAKEKEDSENKVTNKDVEDASSKEIASKVETTILPRRNRFQIQPKPGAKSASRPSATATTPSNQIPANLHQPDTSHNTPSASTEDAIAAKSDNKPKDGDDSKNKDNNKDVDMTTKETAGKIESTVLPRRSRFQAQPKLRVKTTGQSSGISSKPSAMTLAADQPVPSSETRSSDISEVNDAKQKTDSEKRDGHEDTVALSKGKDTMTKKTTISRFKTAGQSSANLTKLAVSGPPEKETPLSSTEGANKLESDKDKSEVKVTDKNAKEISTTLPRRNRFQIQPKPCAKSVDQSSTMAASRKTESNQSASNKDIPSASAEAETSDTGSSSQQTKDSENNDDTASKDAASKIETSVLPRRNRFQIQPRPSAKATKPSSSPSPKLTPAKISSSPSISSNNDTTLTCSEDATKLETDDGQHKDEIKIAEATSKELPLKSEQTPLPTLPRRSRFQFQPKVAVSQTKDNQPGGASATEENSKTSTENTNKSEATTLPRRNRFQIQPKPSAKTVDQPSAVATSRKTESNQSASNKDIPSASAEAETSDTGSSSQQTKDSENNDDTAYKDTASKMEKTAVPTLSRRSRFQVRPKLGMSKESLKGLGKPNEGKEKRAEKTLPKSTTLTVLNSPKDAKRSREDRQSTSPQTSPTQDDLLNSESSRSSEKSDSSVPTSPGKLSGKSSLSSPLKDNIQIENVKQREYPVNVHKSSGKGGKSLPLREKQKKPDISVHPSDKPPDRAKMKMRDLIYWNPTSSPMKSEAKKAKPIRLAEEPAPKAPEPPTNENEPIAVPQVKIGADGNIVLNEESLVINNSQPTAPISMEVVDETDVYSNYGSFRKYTSKSKWSLKDTKKFFLALSTVGTDFSLMTNLFTKKTRRDLKNKFKREERNNQWLVDKAIKQQLHFDEKLFEALSESEEEEEEPPAKKSRQKKDSSESQKKKDTKSGKTKKTTKADTTSTTKKAKKPKKLSTKDWLIGCQEEESTEDMVEEVVEEEPVHDEMLIVPENTPLYDDTLARMQPAAGNQAKPKPTKVKKATAMPDDQSQEDEVVNILMEMGQRGLTSPTKPSGNVPSSAQESPRNKAPAPTMPMINTHSTATAVASKEPEVAGRAKSTPEVPTGVSIPGSSGGGSQTAAEGGAAVSVTPATEEARDSGSLARLFLQQMGLNSQLNALQDEIVSITEAEISHNDQMQKVILVEVQPKDQKQTVVHMYLVSRTDNAQSSADGSGGQVTVSEAQPLALPPSMSCLTDTPPVDVNMTSGTEPAAAQTSDMSTSTSTSS